MRIFEKMTLETFKNLKIGDFVFYKVESDNRKIGSIAKIVRTPYVSVWIILLQPYHWNDVKYNSTDIIIAAREEISYLCGETCKICYAVEGLSCIEVFGTINNIEYGCSACLGVIHFPKEGK